MYSISLSQGQAIRLSDGKVVAPCQSDQDPDFKEYIDWVTTEGNYLTELE